jgi:hypothetical protein
VHGAVVINAVTGEAISKGEISGKFSGINDVTFLKCIFNISIYEQQSLIARYSYIIACPIHKTNKLLGDLFKKYLMKAK